MNGGFFPHLLPNIAELIPKHLRHGAVIQLLAGALRQLDLPWELRCDGAAQEAGGLVSGRGADRHQRLYRQGPEGTYPAGHRLFHAGGRDTRPSVVRGQYFGRDAQKQLIHADVSFAPSFTSIKNIK